METKRKEARVRLEPNRKCRLCWGRGYVTLVASALGWREVRPCACVKALVRERPTGELEQYIRYEWEGDKRSDG